jgi:pimeloyl-ACP methyl ester carboxylesterase
VEAGQLSQVDHVDVDGLRIAYRAAGDGEPVLLINGTGESGATWDGLVERLAQTHRCIAIDNRDTGDSSYVEVGYSPHDMARDAAGVIEALDLGPTHVVGYSLGGAAAQELAIERSELTRSLILLSTWARSDGWFIAQMRNWQAIRRARWDEEHLFLSALEPWLFAPASFARRGFIQSVWDHAAAIETPQRPDGWMRQTDADIAHDAGDRLHRVAVPTTVIVGEHDVCTPPRFAQELCALITDARLVQIPDSAHAVLWEDLDAVAGAVTDHLARA